MLVFHDSLAFQIHNDNAVAAMQSVDRCLQGDEDAVQLNSHAIIGQRLGVSPMKASSRQGITKTRAVAYDSRRLAEFREKEGMARYTGGDAVELTLAFCTVQSISVHAHRVILHRDIHLYMYTYVFPSVSGRKDDRPPKFQPLAWGELEKQVQQQSGPPASQKLLQNFQETPFAKVLRIVHSIPTAARVSSGNSVPVNFQSIVQILGLARALVNLISTSHICLDIIRSRFSFPPNL
ncbi:hypothetical protein BDD12DRAFT_978685 [Trichophaea hybrida]|nr:hypothetical protein BDD12DRAFT_978685 [Trichophaea hybrida]